MGPARESVSQLAMTRSQRCPEPRCHHGWLVPEPHLAHRPPRRCPQCLGEGTVDELQRDLWSAGIVVPEATEEDFRSFPTLCR